jgi:hypothetical protein
MIQLNNPQNNMITVSKKKATQQVEPELDALEYVYWSTRARHCASPCKGLAEDYCGIFRCGTCRHGCLASLVCFVYRARDLPTRILWLFSRHVTCPLVSSGRFPANAGACVVLIGGLAWGFGLIGGLAWWFELIDEVLGLILLP